MRAFAVTAAIILAACAQGETRATASDDELLMPRVDFEAVAENLVDRATVREGDVVLIIGNPRDRELLENLSVHVWKRGAHPMVTLATDRMERRSYDDVPEVYDTQEWAWSRRNTEFLDVLIWVDPRETLDNLAHVPPARIAERERANAWLWQRMLERSIRFVEVGNGLYPIEQAAQRYGLPRHELARIFWDAMTADPAEVATQAAHLEQIIDQASTVHITHPNGTDLRARIGQLRITVSDGVITPDKEALGGAAVHTWLPAGEISLPTTEGTGDGRVVIDRYFAPDQEIRDLVLEFRDGRLVSMDAPGGLGALGQHYELAPPGKDWLASFVFGVNPHVPNHLLTWIPAGMVTINIGGNAWAGGTNAAQWGRPFHLPGATVRVDGRIIIENGELRL
jgi:leucyl aminopeptidase (aminopeptidase T)